MNFISDSRRDERRVEAERYASEGATKNMNKIHLTEGNPKVAAFCVTPRPCVVSLTRFPRRALKSYPLLRFSNSERFVR